MGIFGIYFLICTCLLMVYYVVLIWFDLRGNKGRKKDDSEVISTDGMVDTEKSTDVRELDGGGYQLSTSVEDDGYDADEGSDGSITYPEQEPSDSSVGERPIRGDDGGDAQEPTSDPDPEPDPEPSQFERAKQIHDEEMNPVEHIYQEQPNCRELVAQMACPLSQKTRIYRRRSVY